MMDMNQNMMDARMRTGEAMQQVKAMDPAAQYGPVPMDRALEAQVPNNAITMAQQAVADRAFGNNMSRQMSVDPNITNRIF